MNYVYEKNPDIPAELLEKDKKEVLYFLKIYFTLAFKEGLDENDFEGRWKKFEKIRKEVGKKLKFNIFTNTFSLYGFNQKHIRIPVFFLTF